MKRILLTSLLLASGFACTTVKKEPGRAPAPATAVIELDEATRAPVTQGEVPAVPREATTPAAPADPMDDRLPRGVFADVASFCAAQEELVAPRLAEANARSLEEGLGALSARPACHELPEVLADATTGELLELRTARAEIGGGTEVYLLARGAAGWEAVRTPFLAAFYDDPGCGSIEREHAIKDVHEDGGRLVITTESSRGFFRDEDDSGELTLRYVQTCRPGATCSKAEVVTATAVSSHAEDALADGSPPRTRSFATTFSIDATGSVRPATRFDEARL